MSASSLGCMPSNGPTGTLAINLASQGDSGAFYRLRQATIMVNGPVPQVFHTEDAPDRPQLSADVSPGDYSATLQDGWQLERTDATGTVTVPASLISDNPALFTVAALSRTSVSFVFRVNDDTVTLGQGYDITIGVQEAPLLATANAANPSVGLPASVTLFSARVSGNILPLRIIGGLATRLTAPNSLAVANGQIVVINNNPRTINFYPTTANGNVAPLRQITEFPAELGQNGLFGVSVADGEIYVGGGSVIGVLPFADRAHATRGLTNLHGMQSFAVDHGELYVTRDSVDFSGIEVYPATASGTAVPSRTITLPEPDGCLIGTAIRNGLIYVADSCIPGVIVLPENGSGAVAPLRILTGPSTGLNQPIRVAVLGDELYVFDFAATGSSRAVSVFPLDADGDTAPTRTITGAVVDAMIQMAVF